MTPVQRSSLFGEVNDRIYDLVAADPDLPADFLCECGRDCDRRVALYPAAFARLRATGGEVRSPDCSSELRLLTLADRVPALG